MGLQVRVDSDLSKKTAHEAVDTFFNNHKNFLLKFETKSERAGTMPMLALWWVWMTEIAKIMAANGCTMPLYIDSKGNANGTRPFSKDDAHELYTLKFLGSGASGQRLSWSMCKSNPSALVADKGQKLFAMRQMHDWATDRGYTLSNPESSEYQKLIKESLN